MTISVFVGADDAFGQRGFSVFEIGKPCGLHRRNDDYRSEVLTFSGGIPARSGGRAAVLDDCHAAGHSERRPSAPADGPSGKFGAAVSLTIQAISSHPLLVSAVEEILAGITEYPYLPSVSNEGAATSRTGLARLFLLDACSLRTDLGPLAERCRASSPGSKFITLMPPAGGNRGDEIRLFYWGIDGFVELSETWRTELPQAIRSVIDGQYWVRPQVLTAFVKHAQILEQARLLRGSSLTAREGQIMRLLLRRLTNREISRLLRISERTVKFHVSHILAKFGLGDRRGLLPEAYSGSQNVAQGAPAGRRVPGSKPAPRPVSPK